MSTTLGFSEKLPFGGAARRLPTARRTAVRACADGLGIAGVSAWSSRPARPVDRFRSRDWGLRRPTRYLMGDPSPTRRSACSHPASQAHREAPRAPGTCSWTPIPTNARSRRDDPSSIGREAVAPAVGGDRARAPRARRVVLEPDRRPPGCRHVHPGTPRGWQAGNGGAGEASPCGRSRGHAASPAGGTQLRGAGGDGAARRDADLAELVGTRRARRVRCSRRGRAREDRGARGAQTRPDAYRRAGRPARAGFGDRAAA